jgi:TPR repeat protein
MEKARNGDSFAQLDLGNAYYAAYQMENNCSLTFKWISLSAQQANMEAQFRLGNLYALGQGTEKCHTRAYEWYTKSALQGYSKALARIHNLYEDDKFLHCKGYQNKDEESRWSDYYLSHVVKVRELSEYRLQQYTSIQNHAVKFYQQRFNTLIQNKEMENTDTQLQLGFMYQHGYGTKQNIDRAIECYSTAAKEGVSEAEYNLGDIYINKKQSAKRNTQEAFKWFSKAAKNGNVMAQCSLAHLYEKGIGVEKSYIKALHWYSLAAEMGYTPAQLSIARIHRTGQGVLQDYNKAIEWYNCAAKGGNRAAQNCLDQLHAQDERNPGGNNNYYKNPVNGRRMNSLLRQHISGVKDMNKLEHLKRLALNVMKRDINAMYEVGIKYQDGADLPQDSDLSIKWIKKSARGGLEKAQLAIGETYEQGKLVEQDYHRASIWYRKKPRRKNDTFQYRLGMMYYKGYGVRQDYLEASKWFIKSAKKKTTSHNFSLEK